MPTEGWLEEVLLKCLDLREGALLVLAHQGGIAHHIGGEDGREASLNPGAGFGHGRMVEVHSGFV